MISIETQSQQKQDEESVLEESVTTAEKGGGENDVDDNSSPEEEKKSEALTPPAPAPVGAAEAAAAAPISKTDTWKCSECNYESPLSCKFCGVCGHKQPEAESASNEKEDKHKKQEFWWCTTCQMQQPILFKFCSGCGGGKDQQQRQLEQQASTESDEITTQMGAPKTPKTPKTPTASNIKNKQNRSSLKELEHIAAAAASSSRITGSSSRLTPTTNVSDMPGEAGGDDNNTLTEHSTIHTTTEHSDIVSLEHNQHQSPHRRRRRRDSASRSRRKARNLNNHDRCSAPDLMSAAGSLELSSEEEEEEEEDKTAAKQEEELEKKPSSIFKRNKSAPTLFGSLFGTGSKDDDDDDDDDDEDETDNDNMDSSNVSQLSNISNNAKTLFGSFFRGGARSSSKDEGDDTTTDDDDEDKKTNGSWRPHSSKRREVTNVNKPQKSLLDNSKTPLMDAAMDIDDPLLNTSKSMDFKSVAANINKKLSTSTTDIWLPDDHHDNNNKHPSSILDKSGRSTTKGARGRQQQQGGEGESGRGRQRSRRRSASAKGKRGKNLGANNNRSTRSKSAGANKSSKRSASVGANKRRAAIAGGGDSMTDPQKKTSSKRSASKSAALKKGSSRGTRMRETDAADAANNNNNNKRSASVGAKKSRSPPGRTKSSRTKDKDTKRSASSRTASSKSPSRTTASRSTSPKRSGGKGSGGGMDMSASRGHHQRSRPGKSQSGGDIMLKMDSSAGAGGSTRRATSAGGRSVRAGSRTIDSMDASAGRRGGGGKSVRSGRMADSSQRTGRSVRGARSTSSASPPRLPPPPGSGSTTNLGGKSLSVRGAKSLDEAPPRLGLRSEEALRAAGSGGGIGALDSDNGFGDTLSTREELRSINVAERGRQNHTLRRGRSIDASIRGGVDLSLGRQGQSKSMRGNRTGRILVAECTLLNCSCPKCTLKAELQDGKEPEPSADAAPATPRSRSTSPKGVRSNNANLDSMPKPALVTRSRSDNHSRREDKTFSDRSLRQRRRTDAFPRTELNRATSAGSNSSNDASWMNFSVTEFGIQAHGTEKLSEEVVTERLKKAGFDPAPLLGGQESFVSLDKRGHYFKTSASPTLGPRPKVRASQSTKPSVLKSSSKGPAPSKRTGSMTLDNDLLDNESWMDNHGSSTLDMASIDTGVTRMSMISIDTTVSANTESKEVRPSNTSMDTTGTGDSEPTTGSIQIITDRSPPRSGDADDISHLKKAGSAADLKNRSGRSPSPQRSKLGGQTASKLKQSVSLADIKSRHSAARSLSPARPAESKTNESRMRASSSLADVSSRSASSSTKSKSTKKKAQSMSLKNASFLDDNSLRDAGTKTTTFDPKKLRSMVDDVKSQRRGRESQSKKSSGSSRSPSAKRSGERSKSPSKAKSSSSSSSSQPKKSLSPSRKAHTNDEEVAALASSAPFSAIAEKLKKGSSGKSTSPPSSSSSALDSTKKDSGKVESKDLWEGSSDKETTAKNIDNDSSSSSKNAATEDNDGQGKPSLDSSSSTEKRRSSLAEQIRANTAMLGLTETKAAGSMDEDEDNSSSSDLLKVDQSSSSETRRRSLSDRIRANAATLGLIEDPTATKKEADVVA